MRKLMKGRIFMLFVVFSFFVVTESFAASKDVLVKRIQRAQEYLEDIMESPDTAIPESLMEGCKGIIILRQYKAGFIFGAKGGAGIALVRDRKTGKWSPPAFIGTGEGSFGFQIGAQSIDSIFLIMNKEGMEMLCKSKFKIGVDASAAIGPVGRDAEAKIGAGTAILVYSRAKGLYAGASFEGGLLLSDKKANKKFYGVKGITIEDILFKNKVQMPQEAKSLIKLLNRYSGTFEEGEKIMKMKIESSAFKSGEVIPTKYTCEGVNVSPPLKWGPVPEGTKSFALIVDDPDAPLGTWVHWVIFNLPAATTELAEAIPAQKILNNGGKQGTNDFHKIGYGGPCPPSGTHRYYFKLYVLNSPLNLDAGATKDQLLKAMEGHILLKTQLVGRYRKK